MNDFSNCIAGGVWAFYAHMLLTFVWLVLTLLISNRISEGTLCIVRPIQVLNVICVCTAIVEYGQGYVASWGDVLVRADTIAVIWLFYYGLGHDAKRLYRRNTKDDDRIPGVPTC